MKEHHSSAGTAIQVFTVGHSNLPLERFLHLLQNACIEALADIRRFPGSRAYPHFNAESLAAALSAVGIQYHWIEALGGRRPARKGAPSANPGLRNKSFRAYADYMASLEFEAGVEELLRLAAEARTALMCAEAVYWRCHRRLVSDYLTARGVEVLHIQADRLQPHELTPGAVITAGRVTYPGGSESPLFDKAGTQAE